MIRAALLQRKLAALFGALAQAEGRADRGRDLGAVAKRDEVGHSESLGDTAKRGKAK